MNSSNLDNLNLVHKPVQLEGGEQDRRVWMRLRKGDVHALEILFRNYYALLFDYGMKLAHEDELVKDAIQEVFLYIWETRRNLSVVDSVKAYLLVSLRRLVLNILRKQKRQRTANQEFTLERISDSFSLEDLIIFTEREAFEQQRLKSAFKNIPSRMREALYLKTYDGLTYKEIAKIMNVRPQVVRNYLSEALQRLRSILVK